jgi:hypothetical protein
LSGALLMIWFIRVLDGEWRTALWSGDFLFLRWLVGREDMDGLVRPHMEPRLLDTKPQYVYDGQ